MQVSHGGLPHRKPSAAFQKVVVISPPRAVSSAGQERYFHTVEVRGSNPLQPTELLGGELYTRNFPCVRIIPLVNVSQYNKFLCLPMPIGA